MKVNNVASGARCDEAALRRGAEGGTQSGRCRSGVGRRGCDDLRFFDEDEGAPPLLPHYPASPPQLFRGVVGKEEKYDRRNDSCWAAGKRLAVRQDADRDGNDDNEDDLHAVANTARNFQRCPNTMVPNAVFLALQSRAWNGLASR
ncbi:hypothetical protein KM043_015947 [Ampulex compressa]|nr:hypothetical protein KM043_015947 [Ampulex compressa]